MWFDVATVAPGLHRITEGGWVHAYLLEGGEWAALVDTGLGIGDIGALVRERTSLPVLAINTHGHLDHVGGNGHFDTIFLHEAESLDEVRATILRFREGVTQADFPEPFPEGFTPAEYAPSTPEPTHRLVGGEAIDLGGRTLEVLPVPGHTAGSICLVEEARRFLFAGDMIADRPLQGIGEGVTLETYQQSIALMAEMAPDVDLIFPGHGPTPVQPSFLEELAARAAALSEAMLRPMELGGRTVRGAAVGRFTFFQRTP